MILNDSEKIRQSFLSVATDLLQSLQPGLKVARMPDGSVLTSGNSKHLFKTLSRDGSTQKSIRAIVVDACNRSEALGAGSSLMFIELFISLLSEKIASIDVEQSTADISQKSKHPTLEMIESILRSHAPDVVELVIEAIKVAGSECKIFVEPSVTRQVMIERILGHSFRCDPDPSFFRNGKWTAYDVKCLIIDGVIEKISEIDSLLQRCNNEKRPMVIFARGFDRDVTATLRVNYVRKTLNVIPITVEFDLETVNVLLDIATVVGTDVISSLKGELISTVKFDDIVAVKSISCSNRSASITREGRSSSLDVHIKNLMMKRREETLPTVKQIIDKRLRSLSSSSVIIKIDDSGPGGGHLMHEIDEALRLTRSILIHGIIFRDAVDEKLRQFIRSDGCSTAGLIASIQTAMSLFSLVSSINLAVSASALA